MQRDFTAERPNQLWLTDIAEHRSGEGTLYLCAVKDVFPNRIVGHSIRDRMTSRIAVNALTMAVTRRGHVAGCTVHSDQGPPFRSRKYSATLRRHDLTGSTGQVASASDNATRESFSALLQNNIPNQHR